jgi:hypothetical protein
MGAYDSQVHKQANADPIKEREILEQLVHQKRHLGYHTMKHIFSCQKKSYREQT